MRKTLLFLLGVLLLTAQAEEIDTPLVHAEELPLAVDISPVITFQTDEAGVFAVVTLSSSEELPTPDPSPDPLVTPAPSIIPTVDEIEEETEEPETEEVEETVEKPAAFIISTRSTSRSLVYTLTPLPPEQGDKH